MWCSCVQGLALYINADIKLEGNREAVITDGDFFKSTFTSICSLGAKCCG